MHGFCLSKKVVSLPGFGQKRSPIFKHLECCDMSDVKLTKKTEKNGDGWGTL